MIEPNDVHLILSPALKDGEWEGDMKLTIAHAGFPDMSDDDAETMMYAAYKLAASMPFCISNSDVSERLEEYTAELLDEEMEHHKKGAVVEREGNVITLNFDTPCEGNG